MSSNLSNLSASNYLMMMITTLNCATENLKNEIFELSIYDVEQRWEQLLSTLHRCFYYAQSNNLDLHEYKTDFKEIVNNLHAIEKQIHQKKYEKVSIIDDIANTVISVAEHIDEILIGIGWRKVVRPITEAIFRIPQKILSHFSSISSCSPLLPEVEKYLPPPMLPSEDFKESTPSTIAPNTVNVEWVEVPQKEESFARRLLRKMHDRIDRIESGEE
jgi:hypothetical protein